jgi:hypothetical protein
MRNLMAWINSIKFTVTTKAKNAAFHWHLSMKYNITASPKPGGNHTNLFGHRFDKSSTGGSTVPKPNKMRDA